MRRFDFGSFVIGFAGGWGCYALGAAVGMTLARGCAP